MQIHQSTALRLRGISMQFLGIENSMHRGRRCPRCQHPRGPWTGPAPGGRGVCLAEAGAAVPPSSTRLVWETLTCSTVCPSPQAAPAAALSPGCTAGPLGRFSNCSSGLSPRHSGSAGLSYSLGIYVLFYKPLSPMVSVGPSPLHLIPPSLPEHPYPHFLYRPLPPPWSCETATLHSHQVGDTLARPQVSIPG